MTRSCETHTLVYPKHQFQPEDLLNFIELDWFVDSWRDLELGDQTLSDLQVLIMCNPTGAPVLNRTGGLRKLRFSPEKWNTGKSGALRVCYVYFQKYGTVVLCLAFRKGELDNLSDAGRKTVKNVIKRIEKQLEERFDF